MRNKKCSYSNIESQIEENQKRKTVVELKPNNF